MQGEQVKSESNMKSKLMKQILCGAGVAVLALMAFDARSTAQAADVQAIATRPGVDPATGLPATVPVAMAVGEWDGPTNVLAEIHYDGLPLSEVAANMREVFKNAFDILLPGTWQNPADPSASVEPGNVPISIRLKNVTAGEIFNAMNMVLESQNSPVRWELTMNGSRPTVILRVMQALVPSSVLQPPKESKRLVFFVGDLVGDKFGGMSMEQLVKTVSEVFQMSYGDPKGVVQFHKEAQLLVVTGTPEQLEFIQQTLTAIKQKAQLEHKSQSKADESKVKAEESKTR